MRATFLASLAGMTILCHSIPAQANGRFPQSNQIVFSPTDENRIVARTTYGILPSHDNGKTWGFFCEDALGYSTVASLVDPPLAITADNSIVAGAFPTGLNVSSGAALGASADPGCNWSCVSNLAGQSIADTAARANAPTSMVALTNTTLPTDSTLPEFNNQVFETTDNGVTWSAIGTPIDPTVTVTTIDVSNTDPNRLYVSGTRGYGAYQKAAVFVSIDKGQTWKEGDFTSAEFDSTLEDSIWIGGVSPTDANTFYVRSRGLSTGGLSRLTKVTVAADGTPTLTTAHVFDVEAGFGDYVGQMLGFALSPDGTKIYIGSEESGLWVAQTSDLNFEQKNSKLIVQCLATRETSSGTTELWACSAPVSGFVVGVSTDDGATFTSKLPLIGALTGPIACEPNEAGAACGQTTNSSLCVQVWYTFCATEQCGIPDASAPNGTLDATTSGSTASGNASTPTSSKSSGGCSCDLATNQRGGSAAALGAVTALAVAMQRRRRRKKQPS